MSPNKSQVSLFLIYQVNIVVSNIIQQSSSQFISTETTPLNPIFCVRNRENIKDIEDREEFFILEFDPDDDSSNKLNYALIKNLDDVFASDDVYVVSEKMQVACRDYPHPKHVCAEYPFRKTKHEIFCKLCYCCVCDVSAPCKKWNGSSGNCHALDNEAWKHERKVSRNAR